MTTDMPFNEARPQLASLLRYLLMGAGTFGALRLGSDFNQARQLNNEKAKDKSTLVVDLPENKNPYLAQQKLAIEKAAVTLDALKTLLTNYALPAATVGAGFMGTKSLYDAYQKHRLKKEIENANAAYMGSLANFKQAFEHADTPNVDKFCEAVVEELQKQAGWKLPAGLLGGVAAAKGIESLRDNPMPAAGTDLTASGVPQKLLEKVYQKVDAGLSTHRAGLDDIWGSGLVKDSFKAGFGGVGLMGLYMLIKANMKRQEKEQKRTLPSSVEINYKPAAV